MPTPELLFETIAPMTGHNSTWHLEYEGLPIDVRLEHGNRVASIVNLDTGRQFKTTSKRGRAIVALVLEAYAAQFGDDMDAEREQEFGYICKACNGPAPAGIGYIAEGTDAADASKNITSCECGYSATQKEEPMSTNEKSPAPAATGNEGNKSIEERSTPTGYLHYPNDDTRHTYSVWSGDDLPKADFIRVLLPFKTVQKMYADGPQLIGLNRACAEAQSAEARKQREEEAVKERDEKLRRLRREIEGTTYADEIDALEDKLTEIYARVDAEAKARLDVQYQEDDK